MEMHYSRMEPQQNERKADSGAPGKTGMKDSKIEGERARGGTIILRKPWQRIVFVSGLVALALFLIFASVMGYS